MKHMRVGMLVPWVNTAMEDEIPDLVNKDIGIHWSRVRPNSLPRDGHDDSYLQGMLKDIPNAMARLEGLDLDVVVLGCTSVSLDRGYIYPDTDESGRPRLLLTAFDAVLTQLTKTRAAKIMLVAPYSDQVITREKTALENAGFAVTKVVQLTYKDEIRFITEAEIRDTVVHEYAGDSDVIFLSCTALYTVEAIRVLRDSSNWEVPIISSNDAIASTLNDLYEAAFVKTAFAGRKDT